MWLNLKGKNTISYKDILQKEGNWSLKTKASKIWDQMANCIMRVAKDVLGESKGKSCANKQCLVVEW